MILDLLIALAVLALALVAVVSRRPRQFHVERSVEIDAPAGRIFPHVNASRGWEAWSPWLKLDPAADFRYEGADAGVGAVTHFAGRKVGEGSSTVVESRSSELIRFRLDMRKPFRGSNDVAFTFLSKGERTVVTWGMSGKTTFVTRLVGLFMNCDEMCGRQFAAGLENLKRLVESQRVPA